MTDPTALDRFLRPRSVAVLGASASGGPGTVAARNLIEHSAVRSYLVNPRSDVIQGRRAYAAVTDLPEIPDLAMVTVNANTAATVIPEARDFGVRNFVAIPEVPDTTWSGGRAVQVLGSNCLGFMNFVDDVHAVIHDIHDFVGRKQQGNVALVSQSGGLMLGLMGSCLRRNLGYTYAISTGKEQTLGVEDYLEWLIASEETDVVGVIIEGVRDGVRLLRAVSALLQAGKPVVLFRIGRSAKGKEAVRAHTGKVASDDKVIDGLLRQVGAVVVDDLAEMTETLVAFAGFAGRWPKSRNIGAAMISGGAAALVSDFSDRVGLNLVSLSERTSRSLTGILGDGAQIANPVDIGGGSSVMRPEAVVGALRALGDDASVDAVCFVLPTRASGGPRFTRTLMTSVMEFTARATTPTLVLAPNPDALSGHWYEVLEGTDRVALNEIHSGMKAFVHLCDLRSTRSRERERGHAMAHGASPSAAAQNTDYESLRAWGIPVSEQIAVDPGSAVCPYSWPVAVKVLSPDVPHKADVGAVRLGIDSTDEFTAAVAQMSKLCAESGWSEAEIVVQPMKRFDREFFLSVLRDPTFGPVVVIGMGGNLIEVLPDASVVLAPPLLESDLDRALEGTIVGTVADGYRGSMPLPRQDVLDLARRLLAFIESRPDIDVVELNPVVVDHSTRQLVALDFLVD